MTDIFFMFVLFFAIIISGLCAGISSGLFGLNKYQLKQKAQFGDKDAKLAFSLHAQRYQVMSTLLILNILANTTIVVLINSKISGFFAVLFSTFIILIFGELLPMVYIKKNVIYTVSKLYPAISWLLRMSSPLTKKLGDLFDKWIGKDTQVFYSREELQKMFDGQQLSKNSDIAADEARMIRKVLGFGDKKIRDVMTPRRMVKLVAQKDEVGPILMGELHDSGHSRFPVVADVKHNNFVGTLYLRDLVMQSNAKTVKELMSPHVRYVHEEESLDHALRAFLKLKHHLFVVVNNFEEFVGVLSIEDVLEEIIGKEIVDEFDEHDDLRKVAQSLALQDKKNRSTVEIEE
jgi:metal transporter CNNM